MHDIARGVKAVVRLYLRIISLRSQDMVSQRIQWMMAVACLLAGPVVSTQAEGDSTRSTSFDLKTGARLATTDTGDGERVYTRFAGEGQAQLSADGLSMTLDTLTQRDGDGTVTVTLDGDLTRRGRYRVFVGHGSATVETDGVTTTFDDVRVVVRFRGQGKRLRMIGQFRGRSGPSADADTDSLPDVLQGRIRGQRVSQE
jgi:hypothetical protein